MDYADYRPANAAVDQTGGQAAAAMAESNRRLQQESQVGQTGHGGICRAPLDPNSPEAKQWIAASRATMVEALPKNADGTYTVTDKDCLSTIAVRALHEANKPVNGRTVADEVQHLKDINKEQYPSLAGCDTIQRGWNLKLHCHHHTRAAEAAPPVVPARDAYAAQDTPAPAYQDTSQGRLYRRTPEPLPVQADNAPQYRPLPEQADYTPPYRQQVAQQNPMDGLGQVLGPLAAFAGAFAGGALFGGRHHHYHRGFYDDGAWGYDRGYDRGIYRGYDDYNRDQYYGNSGIQQFPFIAQTPSWGYQRPWRHHGWRY